MTRFSNTFNLAENTESVRPISDGLNAAARGLMTLSEGHFAIAKTYKSAEFFDYFERDRSAGLIRVGDINYYAKTFPHAADAHKSLLAVSPAKSILNVPEVVVPKGSRRTTHDVTLASRGCPQN